MKLRTLATLTLFVVTVAACSGSSEVATPVAASNDTQPDHAQPAQAQADDADDADDADTIERDIDETVNAAEDLVDDAIETSEDFAEDLVESLEDAQAAVGGGEMTLTVGDQSWTFEGALCAFGAEEIGQEGAEFVLSSIQDGKQMYATIDSFGHSVSLDDVQDFENPSVSLRSAGGAEFITIDGKSFSGSAEFFDNTSESFETIPGTFSGTCP